jgi:hypothetical protein
MKIKNTLLVVLGGAVIVTAAGCVNTESGTKTFATSWSRDYVSGRYQRSPDQVYAAAKQVIMNNGVLLTEYIPHDETNDVRSLQGRVNDRKVWVRVQGVDPQTTEVDVQARTSWGTTDLDLVHELEKEIALQLAR